jgi:hypothetical protein
MHGVNVKGLERKRESEEVESWCVLCEPTIISLALVCVLFFNAFVGGRQ